MQATRLTKASLAAIALSLGLTACGQRADEPAADADATDGTAASGEMSVIEARQANFEGMSDAFKVIRDQLEGDAPDFTLITASAQTIEANAALVADYFPEGTGMDSGADTEALATIWERPEDFATAAQNLVTASAAMVEAASSGDPAAVQAMVPELGGTCKACHDDFRVEQE